MVILSKIIDIIEQLAPLSLQESWDNSGLQIGDPNIPITSAVITLDVTMQSVETAIQQGANLIISHHPLLIDPIRNFTPATIAGSIILKAAANNIAIYSSHTAFDSAPTGINAWLAQQFNLINPQPLPDTNLGRHGKLPKPLSTNEFAQLLKQKFNLPFIRTNASPSAKISHLAICGGSGASLIPQVLQTPADTYICGDLKYHNYGDNSTLNLFDIGHFESENQFISQISALFSEKLPNFAFYTLNSNFSTIL